MSANTTSHSAFKGARTVDEIRRLARDLDKARNEEQNFKRAKSIGAALAPMLSEAYWTCPEVFAFPEVRAARRFVAWLKRALYLEPTRPEFYRGGSPGLGKRA